MRIDRSRLTIIIASTVILGLAGARTATAGPNATDEAKKILGDWLQSYTAKDANSDRVLDDAERKPPNLAEAGYATGFLQFEKDGKVAIDKRLRSKGRYRIIEQEPRDQLVLELEDKNIGTYRFLIIQVTDKELVLEPNPGTLVVYRRP